MKPSTILAGCLVAAAATAGITLLTNDDPPQRLSELGSLELGEPATGIGSPEEVVAFWERRAEQAPDGFLDRTQLGIALAAQARAEADLDLYAAAERELRAVVDSQPGYLTAELALGQAVHSQHRFGEALTIADSVLRRQPSSPGALALAGDAAFELGDYSAAEARYQQLAERQLTPPVLSRLSRLAYSTGDPDLALQLAEQALAEAATAAPAEQSFFWFQLGHVQFSVGDTERAVRSLERSLELAPGAPGATEQLAYTLWSLGATDRAEALYAELLEGGGAADLHQAYADLVRLRGEAALADEHEAIAADLAAETIDKYPAERRHLAGYYMAVDPDTAVELAELDLADRRDVGAYDTLAWAQYHAGDLVAADAAADQVLAIGTRDAAMLYHVAAIKAELGEATLARRLVSEALAINARFHPTEAADAATLLARL